MINLIGYLISFLVSSASYVVNLSIPLYLISKFSASPFILGISGFFGNFSYTVFTYIFHKIKWRLNFPWFILSSFLISLVYFVLPFCPHYKYLFFLFFLNGIFYSRFWPSVQYIFSKNSNHINSFNLSWSSGVIFGIFISGYLFKVKDFLPFWIGSFFAFSGFILGFLYFEKFKSFYKGVQEKFGNNRNLDKETKKVLLLNFVNFFAIGGVFFLFPKLATKIGYSSTKISNILSFLFLVRFLMFFVFSKINLKINEKNFFFSYLFVFITLILTGFVKSTFLHTIFISFLGISSAYSYKLGLFTVIKKGYSTEINESIIGIGLFSGPLIVGTLSQFFGIYNGFVLSGFLIILFFLLHKYLIK